MVAQAGDVTEPERAMHARTYQTLLRAGSNRAVHTDGRPQHLAARLAGPDDRGLLQVLLRLYVLRVVASLSGHSQSTKATHSSGQRSLISSQLSLPLSATATLLLPRRGLRSVQRSGSRNGVACPHRLVRTRHAEPQMSDQTAITTIPSPRSSWNAAIIRSDTW